MGETTKIAWTDATFNPWIGCTKISPGCANCYAADLDKRWGHTRWGKGATREVTGPNYWRAPLKWNAEAQAEGRQRRVFCASLADLGDREAPDGAVDWLWELIRWTPFLDWQLLTKRIRGLARRLPWRFAGEPWPNVSIGVSVEDQRRADERIPDLLAVPARRRFLSCEPLLLGPVDLGVMAPGISWVIVGGESGPHARPMDLGWARSIVRQCNVAGVSCFVKQLGRHPYEEPRPGAVAVAWPLKLDREHGADPSEWPEDLRVRQEMPRW